MKKDNEIIILSMVIGGCIGGMIAILQYYLVF